MSGLRVTDAACLMYIVLSIETDASAMTLQVFVFSFVLNTETFLVFIVLFIFYSEMKIKRMLTKCNTCIRVDL